MDNNNVLGGDAGGFLLGLLLAGGLGGGFGYGGGRGECCNPCSGFSNEAVVSVNNAQTAGTTALQACYADAAARALMSDNINELGINNLQGQAALSKQMCDGFLFLSNQNSDTQRLIQQNTIDALRSELTQCRANEAAQSVIATLSGPIQSIACCCANVNSKIPCYPILPDSATATLAAALKATK